MSTALKSLLEQRDTAKTDYDYVAAVYRQAAEAGDLPDGYEAAYVEHRGRVEKIDARIIEVNDEEKRQAAVDEARARILLAPGDGVVRSEPRTYGPENPQNSFWADFVRSGWSGDPHCRDAVERQQKHAVEVTRDAINDPKMRERVILSGREAMRADPTAASRFVNEVRARAMEVRAMTTGSGSGGSFVTPQYMVDEWAAFRQFGREFADITHKNDLPDYGMTIYLPHVTAAAGVATQATQNTGITETDPTAGYLSSGLNTTAGQVTVSQQLLDRAGPGIQFDRIVFTQLNRAYALKYDTVVLTAALANAGTVTNSATGTTGVDVVTSLYSDVAHAIANMADTAGTVLSPSHIVMTALLWHWLQSQVDTKGHTLLTPEYAGAFQAIAATIGKENVVPEGDTGFMVQSLPVVKDSNVPVASSHSKIVVVDSSEVWTWEGPLVPRTIPQTYAQNLSVLLQVYSYNATIVRYQKAVQSISGARYASAPTWKQL